MCAYQPACIDVSPNFRAGVQIQQVLTARTRWTSTEYSRTASLLVRLLVSRTGSQMNTVNLLRKRGVQVRSISDGIDPATSTGRLMLNMLATLAEYERELIVERVNAGIAAARQNGTRFGRPLTDPIVIADKLAIAQDARAKGRTAEDAARLVGWSRATLYRHQQALATRESTRT